MADDKNITSTDEALHAAEVESLEKRIMELALERTSTRNGAIFLWDSKAKGLAIDFHVVEGLMINLPGVVLRRRENRPNGIAMWVLDNNEPYLCNDTSNDPNYSPYFLDVKSVAAVPIVYQRRAIGVISVSSPEPEAFTRAHIDELEALAGSSAKFLRRAQLARAEGPGEARPFLIKGLSPEWLEVERQLEQVSPTDAPVLIHGESGTGKELLAHAIHFNSPRWGKPFVSVNCAAIPETLLESTLFGHMRGAFTGATFTKQGEFSKADGGTLFLDEVGDFPLPLQAKLLRAAESGEIQPLGSNAPPAEVNVRLLCATHHDLAEMVRGGQFRDDLYYRLSVLTMELPPLRSYKQNLNILTQVFVMRSARRNRKDIKGVSAEAMSMIRAYDFPGNVRELRNAIEHAVIMAVGQEIEPTDLPRTMRSEEAAPAPAPAPEPAPEPAPSPAKRRPTLKEQRETWLAPLEKEYLKDLLRECEGNVREAARLAGVNHVTFYRLLKKRGIKLKQF